jgi:FAD synthase
MFGGVGRARNSATRRPTWPHERLRTVNLLLDGVWAGLFALADERHPVAISVGCRPTFYGSEGQRLLEAHVLDFGREICGELVTVWLCAPIRPQRKFDSVDELTAQLMLDVDQCRAWARTTKHIWRSWPANVMPQWVALRMPLIA